MAVNIGPKNIIGCAYYIAGEGRLLCMEDIGDGDHDFVERCKGKTRAAGSFDETDLD